MKRAFTFCLFILASLSAAAANVVNPEKGMLGTRDFLVGCNYWASNAGMYMWRDWQPKAVEKDIAALAATGVNVMRVFPLWPDFQPLTALWGGGGEFRGVAQRDKPLANAAGVDEEMMRRFRFMCDVAARHDVKLVVGLITGWMSGRLFVPPAFEGRPALTDPLVLKWQVRFVRHFVREMKDHPAIAGWDLGNECNCMQYKDISADDAWLWMNAIAGAIRAEDATRPVVTGMHSLPTAAHERWNLRDQGELMDVLTTHPYPLFTPECSKEPFNTLRNELHPTAESLLYAGLSGKPCFVEEAGDLGRCTASPERSAANVRVSLYTTWANGLGAYVWWCGFDQQHLNFPPYTWNAVERELGIFTVDYRPKPLAAEMRAFRDFLKTFPYADLPARKVDAVVLVTEKENGWVPAFGAFLLARQAGFDVVFHGAEQFPYPDARFYILPSGNGIDPYNHEAWQAAVAKAEAGATLLISKGNGTRYSGLRDVTGNLVDYFHNRPSGGDFVLSGRKVHYWSSTTTRLIAEKSRVLAAHGEAPMLTVCDRGRGKVVFCNFAVEHAAVGGGEALTGKGLNPLYLVYRTAADLAGLDRRVKKGDCPGVGLTEHAAADGNTVVVAVNYEPSPVVCPLEIRGQVVRAWRGAAPKDGKIEIPANDAVLFTVK